jgi:hypothetical protein
MIAFDAGLMAAIAAVIVGFLTWAICTQYRHPGCAHLRIRRRPQDNIRLVTLDQPETLAAVQVA